MAPSTLALARAAIGHGARPVRALLFDKRVDANWRVTWHQDVSIAVREQVDLPGFGPWSEKDGVVHVQPPAEILEGMIALRLHLDPCGAENGPVRVLPGSHRAGKLRESEYEGWRARVAEVPCLADRGDVLLMRPLLLHASAPASAPDHRRVLHVEYAAGPLPDPLHWHWEERVLK
jgi:ectoine hydroxylase-related dioxygenase (phytanoyl-CoA dioxygenase family)